MKIDSVGNKNWTELSNINIRIIKMEYIPSI